MKTIAAILLTFLTFAMTGFAANDSASRTDINPALLYWQAVAVMPDRSAQDHLFTNEWRGRGLDDEFRKLIVSYDSSFKLLRHSARQKAPCDWGYDISEGPELFLPSLAKAKSFAQAARLRMRWDLEDGRPDDARDDFLAAFVLGRQLSTDGVLISALVQIAIENILASGLAENWFRLSPETLRQIMDGIAAAPARGTIAQCVPTERIAFRDWLTRKIEKLQKVSNDEHEALKGARKLLTSLASDEGEGPASPKADQIIEAAGGTTAGLLRQLKELDALYDEAEVLMRASYSQFLPGIRAFNEKVQQHPNKLVQVFFPAFEKCRLKEFAIQVKIAMLRAALAYREKGEAGLSQVVDPLFNEPFQFRRFQLDGVDRGFELTSKMRYMDDWNASLIFIEKDGPAFNLDGKNAGKKVN
ncbi:MAG: hypothetical protein EXS31_04825 [Pedosphaera sp.]|nr:hypothetical protein [Pedosphaera sp.]